MLEFIFFFLIVKVDPDLMLGESSFELLSLIFDKEILENKMSLLMSEIKFCSVDFISILLLVKELVKLLIFLD